MSETKNQKPPWADEPTPLCDEQEYETWSEGNQGMGDDYAEHVVHADIARDLEQRLRHAAKKLGAIRIDCMLDGSDGELDPELLEQMLGELEEVLSP